MALKQFIYPLDLSGVRVSNRIDEQHVIGVDRYRAIALRGGPFYPDSLSIREVGNPTPLKRGDDYECVFYYENVARMTAGLEVCGVIVVHNPAVGTDLTIEANIVGGPYAASASAIQDAINQLELDNRNVYWANVIAKPDLWQPTPHLHDLGDIFGFEFIIDLLGAIRDAILVGDNAKMEQIRAHLDEVVRQFNASLLAHMSDKGNPHGVTNDQVNAYTKEAVDAMVLQINQALAQHTSRMNGIDTDIENLRLAINSFADALTAYNSRVDTIEAKQGRLTADIAAINDAIQAINANLVRVWSEIDGLKAVDVQHQTSITKNAQDIATIKQKDAQQDQRLNGLDNSIVDHQNQIDEVVSKADQTKDDLLKYIPKADAYAAIAGYASIVGKIPRIGSNGVLEVTHILDRHMSGTNVDYSIRETTQMNATVGAVEIFNTGRYNCVDIFIRSDLRDKTAVEKLTLEESNVILTQLAHGISYVLKDEKVRTAGLSAQRVREVFPEATVVGVNEAGEERLSLRQGALMGLVVSGYNYQNACIAELTKDNMKSAKRIDALEQQLKELREMILNL